MLNNLNKLSIKTKLTLAIMLTCMALLVIVSATLLIAELYASRAALTQEVKTLASSLAANSSRALVLDKYSKVEDILSSLRQQRNIHAAYVFDAEGNPVAEYLDQRDSQFILTAIKSDFVPANKPYWTSSTDRWLFNLMHFSYFRPVSFGGKRVGSLYLLSDLDSLHIRLSGVVFGIGISFLLLLFCSWFIACWMQKPVFAPLLRLTEVIGEISESKNYSIRAEKISSDEVGLLVDGFNRMLEQIEQQQGNLTRHQQHLETTVAERTAELCVTVAELEQARNQADAANEAKSDFLSKMTHELRTPLIGVLGMNELLQRTTLDNQQIMLTNTVQKSGEELLHLISDVLDISRIEAGKLAFEPSTVDLYRIIEDVVHLLYPQAQEKGLSLRIDIPLDATWKIHADEGRIRQIVMNLVSNAIKFTSSGAVTVSLSNVQGNDGEGLFSLLVTDTGMGMSEDVSRRILDAFYQSDNTGTKESQGAGLGLAIVKQLVELMNGELTFNSAPGKGSTFRVTVSFPLVEKVHFELPEGLDAEPVLLCVGDDTNAAVLRQRLNEFALCVDVVNNGADALYCLHAAKRRGKPYGLLFLGPTVKLTDTRLLYKALREESKLQPLRTILLCEGQSECTDSWGTETRLFLPLSWAGLHEALCRSWKELRLVLPELPVEDRQAEISSAGLPVTLLLGQHIAGRELLRLVLAKQSLEVRVAGNTRDAEKCLESGNFTGLLIDHPFTPEKELLAFLDRNHRRFPVIALVSDRFPTTQLSSFCHSCLTKPLKEGDIEILLKSLLQSSVQSVEDGK